MTILASCATAASSTSTSTSTSPAKAQPKIALLPAGKPIDAQVEQLDGGVISLAALRGHPAVLDVFATWCEPCRVGLPHTDALVAKNAARGLQGWAISIDEELAPVKPFVEKLGLKLPARWDRGGKAADALGVQLLPTLLLLDASGAIRYRALPDDDAQEEHLAEAVEALFAEEGK